MNLAGPQSDRDLFWRQGQPKASQASTGESFDSENARLRNENNLLKDQLTRSLKELKAYQMQYPSPFASQIEPSSEHDEDNPKLTASLEITSALFVAYDTRIFELEETVKQLRTQNESIKENANVLIAENDQLRTLNLQGVRGSVEGTGVSGMRFDPNAPLTAEVFADLQEQLDVLRGENNLLVEQRSVLMNELENHQVALEQKATELSQQGQQLYAAVADVQKLSKRADQAEKDRDAAAAQALSYSDVLGKAEVDQEALQEQLAGLTQRCKEAEGLVQEYKRQLRSISSKGEDESIATTKRVQDAENRVRELHGAVFAKTQELDATADMLRKLRSEYQTTRQDAEGMLQVMGGLERQLNDYAAREAEVEARDKASREREAETLTFREQCAARDDQNKREIERLLGERKFIALRRKDEIEKAIDGTRRAMGEQIASLEKELDTLAEKNAKLIFEAEKAGRDGRSAEELYRRVQRLHEDESKAVQASVKELAEKLEIASKAKEQETAKRVEMQDQLRELRASSEKLRITIDDVRAQLSLANRNNDVAQSALKTTIRDQQKEIADKSRQLTRKSKDYDELKTSLSEQIAGLERRLLEEAAHLQRRSAEADRAVRDFEAAGFATDTRTQMAIDQLKEKYNTAVSLLEARLRTETEQVKALSTKLRQSEAVMADLLEEKSELCRQIDDAQAESRLLEEELTSCKATITDLAGQLSASYQAREDGVNRAARVMEDIAGSAGTNMGSPSRRSFGEFKHDSNY